MKKLIAILVLSITIFVNETSSLEMTSKELETVILEKLNIDLPTQRVDNRLFGLVDYQNYLSDFEVDIEEQLLVLKMKYHIDLLFDMKFSIRAKYVVKDENLTFDSLYFSFVKLPVFLKNKLIESLGDDFAFLDELRLDQILGYNYIPKVNVKDGIIEIEEKDSSLSDEVYLEEANKDLLVIENNKINVKKENINRFINNQYFLEKLLEYHNISRVYIEADKVFIRVTNEGVKDYVLEGEFREDDGTIFFDYYKISTNGERLSKNEIKDFAIANKIVNNLFSDYFVLKKQMLEDFINVYTNTLVEIKDIELTESELIISLIRK